MYFARTSGRLMLLVSIALTHLCLSDADAGVIAVTRQDAPSISGAYPVNLFDESGVALGTLGPPSTTSRAIDIAFDQETGDLYALFDGFPGIVFNLTQNTGFSTGVSVTFNGRGNIAIHNGVIAVTRQDTPTISGALPVYLFDRNGNSLGTVGPPSATSRAVDIAFNPDNGDLFALFDGFPGTIFNLTQSTSFSTGVSVTFDGSGNLAIGNGTIAATRQDNPTIAGALPVYLYDTMGTSLGTLGPPSATSRAQDITFHPDTGDLYALFDGFPGTVFNLSQSTSFSTTNVNVSLDGGGNLSIYAPAANPVPEPATFTVWAMMLGLTSAVRFRFCLGRKAARKR